MKELKPGEVICSKCFGNYGFDLVDNKVSCNRCTKCFGTGKLDWIENIVGKKPLTLGERYYEKARESWFGPGFRVREWKNKKF